MCAVEAGALPLPHMQAGYRFCYVGISFKDEIISLRDPLNQ